MISNQVIQNSIDELRMITKVDLGVYLSLIHIFARLDVKEVTEKAEAMFAQRKAAEGAASEASGAADGQETAGEQEEQEVIDLERKPEITYDDFAKLQFQVGEIIACEEVKKSKKLLCSKVRIGSEVKQIVSGIKAHYLSLIHIFW